jgi:tetratricopeptide (TPR) repeat protein
VNENRSIDSFTVQLASFSSLERANNLKLELYNKDKLNVMIETSYNKWNIFLGPFPTKDEAFENLKQAQISGYKDAFIKSKNITFENATTMQLPLKRTMYRDSLDKYSTNNICSIDSIYQIGLAIWRNQINNNNMDHQDSIPFFCEIINNKPDSIIAGKSRINIGQIYLSLYYRSKKIKEDISCENYLRSAADVFNEYIIKHPNSDNSPLIYKQLGDTYHALTKYDQRYLEKSFNSYRKSINNLGASSTSQEAHMQLIGTLFELARNDKKDWFEVEEEIDKYLTLYSHLSTITSRRMNARVLLMKSELQFFKKDFKQLRYLSNQLITQYSDCTPENCMAESWIARSYLEEGDMNIALDKYQTTLVTCSAYEDEEFIPLVRCECLYQIAYLKYYLKDYEGSLNSCNELITKYPEYKGISDIKKIKSYAESEIK